VQQLAQAANDLAQQRDALMDDVDSQIARAKASVEEEKNRLAALMSELAQAVVVCNLDGRILLYNNRARLQFKALAQGPTSVAGGALVDFLDSRKEPDRACARGHRSAPGCRQTADLDFHHHDARRPARPG
jgi:signal transduction histidine kinase